MAGKTMTNEEMDAIFRENVLIRMADEVRANGALDPELMKDLIVRAARIRCLREAATQTKALREGKKALKWALDLVGDCEAGDRLLAIIATLKER